VTVRGEPDRESGMLMDLELLQQALEETRTSLDHHFLDDIADLGPATLENLCAWIWKRLQPSVPNLFRIAIYRDSSGDMCSYDGPHGNGS
jgi:6-pyruvoyltetrahydropterin/6-carboxytetrahydropterin synthase